MTPEQNELGECIDTLDNLAHSLRLAMPAAFHVELMKTQLPALVKHMKEAFARATGSNPWEGA